MSELRVAICGRPENTLGTNEDSSPLFINKGVGEL